MNSKAIKSLVAIQEIDRDLLFVRKELERIPKELEEIANKVKAHQDKLSEKKVGIDTLLKKRKELEIDMETQNSKVKKLNEQLFTLKSNKEYAAMLKEINDSKEKNSKLEEGILEIMFKCDLEKDAQKEVEKEVKNYELLNQKEKDEKTKEEIKLNDEIQKKLDEREKLVAFVDKKSIDIYDKIFKNKNNYAIVEIKGVICQGCHMGIPVQMINEIILSQELFRCPNCARIVYLADKIEN